MIVWEQRLQFRVSRLIRLVRLLPPILDADSDISDFFTELFKAQVAARIGREPHEILLKRQGERPFKDHLTLEDYGVSNGVQLDL